MLEKVIYRKMSISDVPVVYQIDKMCLAEHWSESAFENDLLYNNFAYYIVAEFDGQIIGYYGLWFSPDEAHITKVIVHPDYRRKGLGKEFVRQILYLAKMLKKDTIILEVRLSGHIAQSLYRKFGFKPIGVRKGYYKDNNEDALVMQVKLNEPKYQYQRYSHTGYRD